MLKKNLPQLRQIGFAANRQVLEVEKVSHANRVGAEAFEGLRSPGLTAEGQRASSLRFGDPRVQALFAVLVLLSLKIEGFRNRQLRPLLAQMLGLEEEDITQDSGKNELRPAASPSSRFAGTIRVRSATGFWGQIADNFLTPAAESDEIFSKWMDLRHSYPCTPTFPGQSARRARVFGKANQLMSRR